ncbi:MULTISPECIES: class II SORL domain-containing protein [Sporomusa]|jgi:superoxide reductase|uniref:Putative superoxide reductase n=1 Tax=uncultured Sporomusa sp. TaxID=307249 RepID=A0A212LQC7_9FIRM|nr:MULTISPECIES: class II SORL domain-containing protein [Sporomusa]MCM0759144.1 class II SORL domain-containing protein [Sporomusa sphaeroides DSM 2875]SCM79629.1 putative superoxide reductase [uncultured Sporomusa sp.]HML35238.1 class II SORL domain-containing protein [Sporomusa sphaeroides]
MKIADLVQSADWKAEKHVPVIDAPAQAKAGEKVTVEVCVGKEIAHPNTTEHHIRWIKLYFKPDNGKFAYEVAAFEFAAHGESVEGANKGPVYTEPFGKAVVKLNVSGTFVAEAYCNIHGLWEGSKAISVEE